MNHMNGFKKKATQELKDLDVERVDGVDRPATGRSFILFKNEQDAPQGIQRGAGTARPATVDEMADAIARTLGRWGAESSMPEEVRSVSIPGLGHVPPDPFLRLAGGARILSSPMTPYFYEDWQGTIGDRMLERDPGFPAPAEGGGGVDPQNYRATTPAPIRKRTRPAGLFSNIFRQGSTAENGRGL